MRDTHGRNNEFVLIVTISVGAQCIAPSPAPGRTGEGAINCAATQTVPSNYRINWDIFHYCALFDA